MIKIKQSTEKQSHNVTVAMVTECYGGCGSGMLRLLWLWVVPVYKQ